MSDTSGILSISYDEVHSFTNRSTSSFSDRSDPQLPWVWQNIISSVLFSMLIWIAFGLAYGLIGRLIIWGIEPRRLYSIPYIRFFLSIGQIYPLWWGILGLVYGCLFYISNKYKHHSLHRVFRTLFVCLYLVPLAYQFGYATFILGYRFPFLLWTLPAKMLWIAPFLAWWYVITSSSWAILNIYRNHYSVSAFIPMFTFTISLFFIAIYVNIGMLLFGMTAGGIAWLAGTAMDFIWKDHNLGYIFFYKGLTIGGSIGFIIVFTLILVLGWKQDNT